MKLQQSFLLTAIALVLVFFQPRASRAQNVARDPSILPPPITRTEPTTVTATLTIEEATAELADGTTFTFWTFDGTVGGPMLRVMEGDTVELTLVNPAGNQHPHNIDLHAVNGPGGGAPDTTVAPGESKTFTFEARHAGAFAYHCAFAPAWYHVARGMYGGVVVEPSGGLPKVDREFYVMQGEWYTTGEFGTTGYQGFDVAKAVREEPEYFTFNGHQDALTEIYPMEAKVGETIRLFFGVGGPNIGSNFHIIGEVFDKVYTGSPDTYVLNEETWYVPPGSVSVFELTLDEPGDYLLVDHALWRVARGALGVLHVSIPEPSTSALAVIGLALSVACARRRSTARCAVPLFVVAIVATTTPGQAATIGFVEDFNSGPGGWGGGSESYIVMPSGGAGGAGDGYLEVANITFPENLGTRNREADYVGDLTSDGVTGFAFALNDTGSDDPLEIHVGIGVAFGNFWLSVDGFSPPEGRWQQFQVDITDPSKWVQIIGKGTFAEAVSNSDRLLFRHDLPPFVQEPEAIMADFGIDRITVLPEPSAWLTLLVGSLWPIVQRQRVRIAGANNPADRTLTLPGVTSRQAAG
jgi:nitrite reductase (NO-forming)